jgi:hypothetical protein
MEIIQARDFFRTKEEYNSWYIENKQRCRQIHEQIKKNPKVKLAEKFIEVHEENSNTWYQLDLDLGLVCEVKDIKNED